MPINNLQRGLSHRMGASLLSLMGIAFMIQVSSAAEGGRGQYEPASALVPAGNTCGLHPEGNTDPAETLMVNADEDGVVRFLAVRPTLPDSVARLALDCTDSSGVAQTYSVDLRSEQTFVPRPFNPALTTLELRAPLARDPLSYTQEELIQGEYGVRPDPNLNPDGYERWLASATAPAYRLRSHRIAAAAAGPRQGQIPRPSTQEAEPELAKNIHVGTPIFWTGAIMTGSYKKGSTAAQTYSYIMNEATWNVPNVYPGAYGTGSTAMTIWNGLDNVFQAIVDVTTTSTTASLGIHHQDIASPQKWVHCPAPTPCTNSGNDTAAITFVPKSGDKVYAEEWYCDAVGNLNLTGGYACTMMHDLTQGIYWWCSVNNSSNCASYALPAADLVNGNLGQTAEFIIEYDTANIKNAAAWPDFSPVTMTGAALVVKGSGTSGTGKWVTTATSNTTPCSESKPCADPYVYLQPDATQGFPRGNGHLEITFPKGGIKWNEVLTNVYNWNGKNFYSYAPGCATSIGVGPKTKGRANGTPWIVSCPAFYGGEDFADGNQSVWQLQNGGSWAKKQADVATQVALAPEGNAWAINKKGDVLFWAGKAFASLGAPVNGTSDGVCARSIGVGPNSGFLTSGTPWIVGCHAGKTGNFSVYELQTGGTSSFHLSSWVKMQDDVAMQIAVSPEGVPWIVDQSGQVLYWNGKKFVASSGAPCAISIGVGPNSFGLTNGTPWIVGCKPASDGNFNVSQMQTGGSWVTMQSDAGTAVAVSPDKGIAWILSGPSSGSPPAAQAGSRWP